METLKEKKMDLKFKRILLVFLGLALSVPFVFQVIDKTFNRPEEQLKGSYTLSANPKLTVKSWLSGDYSKDKETYLNQNFGFRTHFVKSYNQINFSLFKISAAQSVVVGKNDYLYQHSYIDTWVGRDFSGDSLIQDNVQKLMAVSDTLKKKGVELVLLFAPGKAYYLPEFLPDSCQNLPRGTTNYETYTRLIHKEAPEIRFLDFHQWFGQMKDTATYPLFPQTGIHWSKYGELIAADSLLKYINTFETTKKVPLLKITNLTTSTKMWDTDNDIEKAMNLIFPLKHLRMAYGRPEYIRDSTKEEPKVLTIGDSFYWGMYNYQLSNKAFDKGEFWYYFNLIYPQSFEKDLRTSDIDYTKRVEENDIVLIVSTDENLKNFTFGFIQDLYKHYFGDKKTVHNNESLQFL